MRRGIYVLLGVLLVPTVGLVGDVVTDGQFKSTMSTGAPLDVASDDLVANLNADMVDGVEGTDIYTKAEVDALVAAAAAADSRRWYYLTSSSSFDGSAAFSACDSGFHMASIWEIMDTSNMRYDTARGEALDDSGNGPPVFSYGWVRTGDTFYAGNEVGLANCNAWSSSSASHFGTLARLPNSSAAAWNAPATRISPWEGSTDTCDQTWSVWCVED
jgi:hypothetical protein